MFARKIKIDDFMQNAQMRMTDQNECLGFYR